MFNYTLFYICRKKVFIILKFKKSQSTSVVEPKNIFIVNDKVYIRKNIIKTEDLFNDNSNIQGFTYEECQTNLKNFIESDWVDNQNGNLDKNVLMSDLLIQNGELQQRLSDIELMLADFVGGSI